MGKKATARTESATSAKSVTKNIRVSPRKLNLVAGTIRGRKIAAALAQLSFSPKRIALDVRKALQSAVANAENNHQLDVDRLIVKEAYVGNSFSMRRFHTRGRGRSSPIEKPFAHLTIVVEESAQDAAAKNVKE